MHVVGFKDLVFLRGLFCSDWQERSQVDLLCDTLKESLVECELVQVYVFQHVVHFVVRLAEAL